MSHPPPKIQFPQKINVSWVFWTLNAANFYAILWVLLTRYHPTMAPNTAALTPFFLGRTPHFTSWSTTLHNHYKWSQPRKKPLIWTSAHLPRWTGFRSPCACAPAIVSEISCAVSRTAISHRRRRKPDSLSRSTHYRRLSGWDVSMEVEKSWAGGLNSSLAAKTKAADRESHFSKVQVSSWKPEP